MRGHVALGIALSLILISGIAANSFAQDERFSARILAKASKSNVLILVKNSSKSTESIYEFSVTFTSGKPLVSLSRSGWEGEKSGNTVTFTTEERPIGPGGRMIFLIKVSGATTSAFEWEVWDKDGQLLQSGELAKVRVRERRSTPSTPAVTEPEINVDPVRVNQSGQIVVTGKGFNPSSTVEILLDDNQQLTTSVTNIEGEFSAVIIIPDNTLSGGHMIVAKDALGKSSLIQILVEGVGGQAGQPGELKLTINTDKEEYSRGDLMRITGTAVLTSPVSLKITDPIGEIICGSNPRINNATLTWESFCTIPGDARAGVYIITASQIVHETNKRVIVEELKAGDGGGVVVPGEDPGSLKLSIDKSTYESGETVEIRLEGARPESIVQIIIVGPSGPPLEADRKRVDENGVLDYEFDLVAAVPGTYKVSVTQDTYKVRATFEVTE